MCILSIYSNRNGDFILTQNRDENIFRPTSDSIQTREIYGEKFTGPVDLISGGTWIYHTDNYVVCVLNGALKKHKHLPPYRMSRGLVILELLKYESPKSFFENIDLNEIEPFTMVIVELKSNSKFILVWDGQEKFIDDVSNELLIAKSSSTLYDFEAKNNHLEQFKNLKNINSENIVNIHNQLKMNKNEVYSNVQTTSITQIIFQNSIIKLNFCQF